MSNCQRAQITSKKFVMTSIKSDKSKLPHCDVPSMIMRTKKLAYLRHTAKRCSEITVEVQ